MFWVGIYVGGFIVTVVNCVFGFFRERAIYKAAGTKTKTPVTIILACFLTVVFWPLLLVYALVNFDKDGVYGPFLSVVAQEGSIGVVEETTCVDEFEELKRKLRSNTGEAVAVEKKGYVGMVVCIKCSNHYELDLTVCPICGFKSAGMLG